MYYQSWRKNKYNNHTCQYGGSIYDSIKEADYAQELDFRLKAKDIKSWRRQIPIDLVVNGYKICTYKVDFEITHNNKSKELVEIKGFETPEFRLKKKLIEATFLHENPEYSYSLIK